MYQILLTMHPTQHQQYCYLTLCIIIFTASGCHVPDPVNNVSNTTSTVLLSNSMYSTGTVVTYTCLSGYDMIGSSLRTCQSGGYWDELPPFCAGLFKYY